MLIVQLIDFNAMLSVLAIGLGATAGLAGNFGVVVLALDRTGQTREQDEAGSSWMAALSFASVLVLAYIRRRRLHDDAETAERPSSTPASGRLPTPWTATPGPTPRSFPALRAGGLPRLSLRPASCASPRGPAGAP